MYILVRIDLFLDILAIFLPNIKDLSCSYQSLKINLWIKRLCAMWKEEEYDLTVLQQTDISGET